MKKRIVTFLSITLLSLSAVAFSSKQQTKNFLHNTTVAVADAGSYYDGADTSSRQNLMSSLHTIINNGAVNLGYDGLWSAYSTTDCKPGTNYIWDMYSNVNFECGGSKQGASYKKEGDGYNREHTVPQSWFSEALPMKADLFHVYPTDGYVNNRRSNYPHGNVSSATYTSENGSKLGPSADSGYSGTVFEPIDEYKGDFARTYFYMATRYSDKVGNWTTGEAQKVFKGSFPYMQTAFIDIYYQWHKQDPVSAKETARNEAAYKLQKNRNPYIDHPEWADYIFKGEEGKTVESLAVSGTPTKTKYTAGESFSSSGLTVTATYTDKTTGDVTSSVSWTPNPLTAGTTSVTGTYQSKTVTVSGITVDPAPTPTTIEFVLNKSNSDLTTSYQTVTKTYAINDTLSMKVDYTNVCNNSKYDEISLQQGTDSVTPGKIVANESPKVIKMLVDYYKSNDDMKVTADGEEVTGTLKSSENNHVVYEYPIDSNIWSIESVSTQYTKNIWSVTFYFENTNPEAETWAESFKNGITCDQGITAPSTTAWNNLKTSYESLSTEAKTVLKNATYTISGSGASTVVTPTGSTSQKVADAIAKYDFIINKYGSATYNNFIGRDISETNRSAFATGNITTALLIILPIIADAAVGIIFLNIFSKKKHRFKK